jgi:serralysin
MPPYSKTKFVDYVDIIAGDTELDASGPITFNLSGLSDHPAQAAAAKMALQIWSQLTGLDLRVTTSRSADVQFSNDGSEEAYTGYGWPITINISKDWMDGFSTSQQWTVGSYGLQTFMHEIGHALGLEHGGNYNGTGSYKSDRGSDIDTLQFSIMSYFDQSNYGGASNLNLHTPMLADLAAIRKIWGERATNTGDTLYGAKSTVLMRITDFGKYKKAAFSIHDTDGYDTLDLSNTKKANLIDLRPGSYSNINGYKGNVGISEQTNIEQAFGGSANDEILGNSVGNRIFGNGGSDKLYGYGGDDLLNGGDGRDTLRGGEGADRFVFSNKLSSAGIDTLADFMPGADSIHLENAVFTALKSVGQLAGVMFSSNTSGKAKDATTRIIYDSNDGYLAYDPDGSGKKAATKIAVISKGLALTHADFWVI